MKTAGSVFSNINRHFLENDIGDGSFIRGGVTSVHEQRWERKRGLLLTQQCTTRGGQPSGGRNPSPEGGTIERFVRVEVKLHVWKTRRQAKRRRCGGIPQEDSCPRVRPESERRTKCGWWHLHTFRVRLPHAWLSPTNRDCHFQSFYLAGRWRSSICMIETHQAVAPRILDSAPSGCMEFVGCEGISSLVVADEPHVSMTWRLLINVKLKNNNNNNEFRNFDPRGL